MPMGLQCACYYANIVGLYLRKTLLHIPHQVSRSTWNWCLGPTEGIQGDRYTSYINFSFAYNFYNHL